MADCLFPALAGYKKSEEKGEEDEPPKFVKLPMPTLQSLNLSRNELGIVGAKWVVTLMELIPSLMSVELIQTRLTEVAVSLLEEAAELKGAILKL
eukprot:5404543-Prymnesium_polylepis.2